MFLDLVKICQNLYFKNVILETVLSKCGSGELPGAPGSFWELPGTPGSSRELPLLFSLVLCNCVLFCVLFCCCCCCSRELSAAPGSFRELPGAPGSSREPPGAPGSSPDPHLDKTVSEMMFFVIRNRQI